MAGERMNIPTQQCKTREVRVWAPAHHSYLIRTRLRSIIRPTAVPPCEALIDLLSGRAALAGVLSTKGMNGATSPHMSVDFKKGHTPQRCDSPSPSPSTTMNIRVSSRRCMISEAHLPYISRLTLDHRHGS